MWEFFDFVLNIFGWIIEGIRHILIFIEAIPTYLSNFIYFTNTYTPAFLLPFVVLGITVTVVIRIKRLVL